MLVAGGQQSSSMLPYILQSDLLALPFSDEHELICEPGRAGAGAGETAAWCVRCEKRKLVLLEWSYSELEAFVHFAKMNNYSEGDCGKGAV